MRRTLFGAGLATLAGWAGVAPIRRGTADAQSVAGSRSPTAADSQPELEPPFALVTPVVLIQHHRTDRLGGVGDNTTVELLGVAVRPPGPSTMPLGHGVVNPSSRPIFRAPQCSKPVRNVRQRPAPEEAGAVQNDE